MALAPIIMPIVSIFKSAGVKSAQNAVQGLSKNFGSLAGQLGKAAGAFAAFQGVASARQFTIDSVNATQQFERNLLALQQTFETATPGIMRFTKEVENYGISQQQAAKASVFLGSVLKQYGFNVNESAAETERLVTLAQDLATTYGYELSDALLAITALFRGEYDPIEKFGVAMKQNEINAYLAAQGLGDLTGAERANAEATARLTLLFERAGDSVGAFERASDTLYGSQQRLNAVMGNLQVAFGEAFQRPLAQVNDALATVAADGTENLVDISKALAGVIEGLVPLVESLGGALLGLFGPMEQVIALSGGVATGLAKLIDPLLQLIDGAGDDANIILDAIGQKFIEIDTSMKENEGFKSFMKRMKDSMVLADLLNFAEVRRGVRSIQSNTKLKESQTFSGVQATEARRDAVLVETLAIRAEVMALAVAEATRQTANYGNSLKNLGFDAEDAEGNLIGLAGVFAEIELAARQSQASEALDDIGFSAEQIENILTRPDWETIFGDIARLAYMASSAVGDALFSGEYMSLTGAAGHFEAKRLLEETLREAFGGTSKKTGAGSPAAIAKDTVKDFFDSLQDEIMQQSARLQLEELGASDGLIGMILGQEDWLKVWIKIKQGVIVLDDLQDSFNRTVAGAAELAATSAAWDAYKEAIQSIKDELLETIKAINEQADALKLSFSDLLLAFDVLPTIAVDLGRFETAAVSHLASIEQALQSAFRNGDLFEDGYRELQKFAQQELKVLQAVQRQRDDMANRYSLSEALIGEYRDALAGAMSLTAIFNSLKDETETRTITEVSRGVIKLGEGLREFNVIVTKEYEQTIGNVTNKTAGLLDGFKAMSIKSKDFAENLRTLRDMGLDPQLFDQLVRAGVEAGGQTAQALVDGGDATITEISALFAEVNTLGAELGEEVAVTLYGTGIDLVDGLLAGITSQQESLEEEAERLATAFSNAFKNSLDLNIDLVTAKRVADATAEANKAIAAVPVPDSPRPIDEAAFAKITKLMEGAERFITNSTGGMLAGGQAKLDIYKAIAADISAGGSVDLSGIQSGLSTSDLLTAAKQSGSATVTQNFTLNITADTRAGGTKAGEAVVGSLKNFEQQNGSINGFLVSN